MPNVFDLDAELDRIIPGPTADSSEDRTIASVSIVLSPDGATVSPDAGNLTADQFSYFIGRKYARAKRQGTRTDLTSDQNDQKLQAADRIAEAMYGFGD
jgi:hypothetical protein